MTVLPEYKLLSLPRVPRQNLLRTLFCCSLLLHLAGCTTPLPRDTIQPISPFRTDGCTLAPDINVRACCERHDRAYWAGGSCEQRQAADREFRQCMIDNGRPVLASVYYTGVRIAGSPLWPFPWRWGFGWPYGMGYSEQCD